MRPTVRASTDLDLVVRYAVAADRFAREVVDCDLRAPVPGLSPWSTYDLVVHLGNTHAWAATIVETGRFAVEQNDVPRSHKPRVVGEWYEGKAEDLYRTLRAADPHTPCWNFAFGDGEVGFWPRRQAHETTMHLLDLCAAQGTEVDAGLLDPALCADGVDEVLTVFLHRMHHRGHPAALTAPLCLVATDTGDAWTVTPRPLPPRPDATVPAQSRGPAPDQPFEPEISDGPPLVVKRRHPAADRVEARADVLYRLLWKRLPDDALGDAGVTVTGDTDRVAAFLGSRLVP